MRYRVVDRPAGGGPDVIDFTLILAAGVASGTILLFAAVGEIFAERSGVLNLGVEGMMLMGAVAGFSVAASTGDPWIGLVVAMLAGGLLSLHPRGRDDPPPSRPGHLGPRADVPRHGPRPGARRRAIERRSDQHAPPPDHPGAVADPAHRPDPVPRPEHPDVRRVACSSRSPGSGSTGRVRGSTCGRSASVRPRPTPRASTSSGTRYAYVLVGGLLAGLAGATITLAISPGWFGDQTVGGKGWIAIGLVIFAQWSPIRAAIGAYLFGAIFRFILDLQGVKTILGFDNPFQAGRSATFFLEMLPYLFVVVVVIIGSREALRRRVGAPAALGIPYVRGERGA